MSKKLFIYGFPDCCAGADTKLYNTLPLFKEIFEEVMCIANAPAMFNPRNEYCDYLDGLGIKYGLKESMSGFSPGDIALSLCNPYFFKDKFIEDAKSKGLKVIWSSEMMWHHVDEKKYIEAGMVDKVLYVSDIQKAKLTYPEHIPWTMTGNYINPDLYPFRRRSSETFGIGRLSRPDSYKYPEDFPVFYEEIAENLDPRRVSFRVMAWNKDLTHKYRWHNWNRKYQWVLLEELQMPVIEFLYGLTVHAYPLGHNFIESWGRSTVESMLSGCIPIFFSGHHLENLIEDKRTGFIADDIYDWKNIIQELFHNIHYRFEMAKRCSEHAREVHCNKEQHIKVWEEALLN